MVQTLPKKVFQSLPRLIELFSLILGETNDGIPNLIGFSYGKVFLQELLLHLGPRIYSVCFQGIEPMLGFLYKREWEETHP